jgi:rare lipoprotein A
MYQRKVLAIVAALVSSITLTESAGAEPGSWSEHFQSGQASWYGPGFHGRKTASGEIFNTQDMTAAHRTLPFGSRVRVTNQRTGRSTIVRINDRGPYAHGRIIDLSRASAEALGIAGVASVSLARL